MANLIPLALQYRDQGLSLRPVNKKYRFSWREEEDSKPLPASLLTDEEIMLRFGAIIRNSGIGIGIFCEMQRSSTETLVSQFFLFGPMVLKLQPSKVPGRPTNHVWRHARKSVAGMPRTPQNAALALSVAT